MVVPLNVFDVVFGVEFCLTTKASITPHLSDLMILDERCQCFVKGMIAPKKRENSNGIRMLFAYK